MRRRQLKWLWGRRGELQGMRRTRDELLMKLGAAKTKAPAAWQRSSRSTSMNTQAKFTYRLNRKRLRQVRRREGRYLLRTNRTETDPVKLWNYYLQLVQVEEAFRTLNSDLAIRPSFHQDQRRIEAHVFIAFLAYCLYVTLARRLKPLAPGLTARSALEKFAAVQMVDVHVPTTDGRELCLTRYTQPEPELALLLERLQLTLPPQPPPKITAAQAAYSAPAVVQT
jgi:IS4 transposase